ncbi:MAG: hypothetical protein HYV26_14500 [Candidatus Hydrogenedentes bacterium]|nr:hypothetical protein [Candidatus Hydrogenedentota bacterium]
MRLSVLLIISLAAAPVLAAPLNYITIDGAFGDWTAVQSYSDPLNDQHDTDHDQPTDTPLLVDHPDVDLLSFKFTHDEESVYAYFRSRGVIGRTQQASAGKAGRYYVIVTIDVDDDDVTGYPLHEGGYYPTSAGYDMNMEVEFYDGAYNTGHYLNHGCLNEEEFFAAQEDQKQEIVDVRPGTYDWYTQWVMFLEPQGFPEEFILPSGRSIVWVEDKGPVYQGILTIAVSPDGHEAEMKAPFVGFMRYPTGEPIVSMGRTMDISFSLEASGELAPDGEWGSDTADPIVGYTLEPKLHTADIDADNRISLSEVLRVVQFYNFNAYHCAAGPTEDGFDPGSGQHNCTPHESDYAPQNWAISLSELLRAIQIYNSEGYHSCRGGEDGYCIGLPEE